jgi:hypothetical protein
LFAEGEPGGERIAVIGPCPNPHRDWSYDEGSALRVWELAQIKLDFWNLFDREPETWNANLARTTASVWRTCDPDYTTLILLGAKVRDAFGLQDKKWLDWSEIGSTHMGLVLPHPSGLNRWWNNPRNRVNAQNKVREIIREGSPVQ